MLKNYITVAFRSLVRNRVYSLINILGLTVGIACFMVIAIFVHNEYRYDRFHSKADRIYRVCEKIDAQGHGENSSSNPFFVGKGLANDYPQLIEHTVRFFNFQSPAFAIQIDDRKFVEKRLFFADSTVFKVFDFALIQGDPSTALARPNSIVLTTSTAKKYFGDENPIGKILRYEGSNDLAVTGIVEDVPPTSHIHFDGLISFSTLNQFMGPNFEQIPIWNPCWTYILLKVGVTPSEVETQFPSFVKKYHPPFMQSQVTHYLQPLGDIHLTSKLDYEIQPNGDLADVYIFSVVGILILLISCINFMNLATARSAGRAREVGMRKVLGAYRQDLVRQFLGESLFIAFIAVILACGLIEALLPAFNQASGKSLAGVFSNPIYLIGIVIVGTIAGLLSGLYPAFFLSAFQPVRVLKGSFKSGVTGQLLRQSLVVAQFTISVGLIVSAFVVFGQLKYMRNADLGFQKDAVIFIPTRPTMAQRFVLLKEEMRKVSSVKNVTGMNEIVGRSHNTYQFNYEGMKPDEKVYLPGIMVDEDFVPTMGIEIIAGRNFSRDFKTDDSLGVLINEAMVKQLGWGSPEAALGKQCNSNNGKEVVIGVFRDFHYESLLNPVGGFFLDMPLDRSSQFFWRYLGVKIQGGDYTGTVRQLEEVWNRIIPEFPFEYFFLDDNLQQMYQAQDNLGKLVGYFSALAIFVACLGMFALASFTAEQRTKEIAIRKTLGASVGQIIALFSKDFLKLVGIAAVVGSLASYYAMSMWLQSFAYRMSIGIAIFVLSTLIALGIAMLTVSYQSVRVATGNPVDSLKYE
jgi:putative ABC transport system permease protein